ncbi:biotin-acetyl-CoA-carboxylase ligase [Wolbachia endosymbiont of Armadillidium vulgare str. wVulC]|nr:biotin-acetyl-CoA-carboxylase ligase [Wolbachia endosymbiont of Armadillidium vulgare str. wVulC]
MVSFQRATLESRKKEPVSSTGMTPSLLGLNHNVRTVSTDHFSYKLPL